MRHLLNLNPPVPIPDETLVVQLHQERRDQILSKAKTTKPKKKDPLLFAKINGSVFLKPDGEPYLYRNKMSLKWNISNQLRIAYKKKYLQKNPQKTTNTYDENYWLHQDAEYEVGQYFHDRFDQLVNDGIITFEEVKE